MSFWNVNTHIRGKVYDLTQENMTKMIDDIERLKGRVESLNEQIRLMKTITVPTDQYYVINGKSFRLMFENEQPKYIPVASIEYAKTKIEL